MNILTPSSYEQIVGQGGFFNHSIATSLGKENFEFKPECDHNRTPIPKKLHTLIRFWKRLNQYLVNTV